MLMEKKKTQLQNLLVGPQKMCPHEDTKSHEAGALWVKLMQQNTLGGVLEGEAAAADITTVT